MNIFRALGAMLLVLGPLSAQNAIRLRVDATDAPRRIFHVQMTMPVQPGALTLLYPEWIPGEHGPTGPIANLVGLRISSGAQAVAWKRDSVNVYAFHLEVPAGASSLDIAYDFISPPEAGGFSSGSSATTELAVLNWNQLVLYQQGKPADSVQYQANLRVPPSWRYGTALPIERENGSDIEFKPASLTTLIDSPVSTGRHYRTIELGTDNGIPHYLHLAGDGEESIAIPDDLVEHYKTLVAETGALFGARHYRDYHFLVTLSDHVANFGLEHHESSDDRLGERTLIEGANRKRSASLLPHEFFHSWNGKYRRPSGLLSGGADGGYDTPMKGDLLWVYEGLTNYYGEVLAARSGLWSAQDYLENLAATAAQLDERAGRAWRPLEDTAVFAQVLYNTSDDYRDYRRSTDYYAEGSLIWLEADVMIRQLSKGAKSLDDFCRAFHGGASGAPELKPYDFDDVVAGLNAVQPYDWAAFLHARLQSTSPRAPLGGIEQGGWKLAFAAERSDYWKAEEESKKLLDLSYSLGLRVQEDGWIIDVAYNGPAHKAGVTPSVRVIAVNGRQYSTAVLRDAVKRGAPVELLIKNGEFYESHRIEYSGGERYPQLIRQDGGVPDLLTPLISSRTAR